MSDVLDPREDTFLHGGEYTPSGKVRPKACSTCAFRNVKNSVRPPDVSITELIAWTDTYDDFFCHQSDKDCAETCAAWHALQQGKTLNDVVCDDADDKHTGE